MTRRLLEEEVLSLTGVRFAYGEAPLIRGVELGLAAGEAVWISGPSGGGKSTLLRLMNRLLSPSGGNIRFLGRLLEEWPPPQLRRRAVLLGQAPVMTAASLADNLYLPFGFRAARDLTRPPWEEVAALLASLGLPGLAPATPAGELSVGQRQRVALARVLLLAPRLLLLDEPLAPLDPASRGLVEERLEEYLRGGGAVVLVSHQEPLFAHRGLELVGGRLFEAGGPGPYPPIFPAEGA
ncbi:MAG: ATP-binding cassette domain-containing protein [Deltaproteobacteria bacterium]|nr:ATP-binding cassette domain-containing protein [Deltaproteobacteria bacterium]